MVYHLGTKFKSTNEIKKYESTKNILNSKILESQSDLIVCEYIRSNFKLSPTLPLRNVHAMNKM